MKSRIFLVLLFTLLLSVFFFLACLKNSTHSLQGDQGSSLGSSDKVATISFAGEDTDDEDEDEIYSPDDIPAELSNIPIPNPDQATQEKMFQFQCLRALANSLPTPFCWAKKIYSPKRCPADYPYRGHGRCRQSESRFSKFITFLSSRVECEPGDTKTLGICTSSDRCKILGYVNCGIVACSQTKTICVNEVTNIVLKSLKGLMKMSAFIASLGTSSAASSFMAVIQLFAEIQKDAGYAITAIKTIVGSINSLLTQLDPTKLSALKTKIVAAATEKVKRYLPMVNILKMDQEIIQKVTYVFDNIQKVKDETKGITDTIETKLRKAVSNKIDDIKKCFQSVSTDIMKGQLKDVLCYKNYILPIVEIFDPTGITSIVSAFVYPICPHEISEWIIRL